jgi:hypothetical protein
MTTAAFCSSVEMGRIFHDPSLLIYANKNAQTHTHTQATNGLVHIQATMMNNMYIHVS